MRADDLPKGWAIQPLSECVQPKELWNPRHQPRTWIRYLELAGIDNERGIVASFSDIKAAEAPSRARKIVRAGDVVFATTRPNLKNIAIVPKDLDNEICSTGFCVLRPKSSRVSSGWIYSVVRSDWFINQVIRHDEKNAYPSVSDGEVLAVEIPVPPMFEQNRIMARVEQLCAHLDEARLLLRETETELAAFTPALLAKAFRGEL